METYILFIAAATSYISGSISFTRLMGRLFAPDVDIEETSFDIKGTEEKFRFHSVSATTMAVKKGPIYGMTTSILDMAKAFIPVYFFASRYPGEAYHLVASLACLLGHNFPVFYRSKGGRGMSPLFGSLLVLDWRAILVTSLGGMFIGAFVLRDMFFAFMSGPVLLVPWMWYSSGRMDYVLYAVAVNIAFWSASFPEVRMYLDLKGKGLLQAAETLEKGEPGRGGIFGRFARVFGLMKEEDE